MVDVHAGVREPLVPRRIEQPPSCGPFCEARPAGYPGAGMLPGQVAAARVQSTAPRRRDAQRGGHGSLGGGGGQRDHLPARQPGNPRGRPRRRWCRRCPRARPGTRAARRPQRPAATAQLPAAAGDVRSCRHAQGEPPAPPPAGRRSPSGRRLLRWGWLCSTATSPEPRARLTTRGSARAEQPAGIAATGAAFSTNRARVCVAAAATASRGTSSWARTTRRPRPAVPLAAGDVAGGQQGVGPRNHDRWRSRRSLSSRPWHVRRRRWARRGSPHPGRPDALRGWPAPAPRRR